jgi:hypothetical protein
MPKQTQEEVEMDTLKVGAKLQDPESGVEAIVIRASTETGLRLRPGGQVLLGKRYVCQSCGAEVLVTKGGDGEATCHGGAMPVAEPKPLPSSD